MSSYYRVLAPYVTVRVLDTPTGKPTVYGFYQGAFLPASTDPASVVSLLEKGMVKREAVPEVPVAEAPAKAEPAEAPAKAAAEPAKPAKARDTT